MVEGSHHETHVTGSYGVQVGDNNKINQEISYVLRQRYKGRDARLRRSLDHDIDLLKRQPNEEVRGELLESIQEKTAKLVQRHRTQNQRRVVWVASTVVVIVVVGIFGLLVADNHAKLAHGRPGETSLKHWGVAVGSVLRGEHLSPRGNVMSKPDELFETKYRDTETGEDVLIAAYKLIRLVYVKTCAPGSVDQTPHSKNGRSILLEFELKGGVADIGDATAFSRDDFIVYDLDGNKFSIGDSSGEECMPEVVDKDGIGNIPAGSTQRVLVLADVPSSGYITYSPNSAVWWPREWRY
ncbi:hypothetical protein [Nocardia salmonicida]